MPFGSVLLKPGVNVEETPTLLETGYAASQLIRYRNGLAQKYGGWERFYLNAFSGTPRDLHAWEDLNQVTHLGIGTTAALYSYTPSVSMVSVITPQTVTSNISPNFSTTSGQPIIDIVDSNISNVTTLDSIILNTPVTIGGLVLSGVYPITNIVTSTHYQITAAANATATVNNAGAVPSFTASNGNNTVTVTLAAHNLIAGNTINFPLSTTGNGVTIFGTYSVVSVSSSSQFVIYVSTQATSSGSFNMNSSNAQIVYYITLGPPAFGSGYGSGGYGQSGYGQGSGGGSTTQTGTPISATDWTQDNWGQLLISCPANGGIYSYNPTGGTINAQFIASAPPYNGGAFVSTSQEILVCWASTVTQNIGISQDPLWVQWSNVGDYTNFVPTTSDQAGGYRIPTGSKIVGGIATPNQNLIWTDEDCWSMSYQGPPFVFGFNKVGAGAGLSSSHAAQTLRGNVYWMGTNNFYSYTASGINAIPCPIWDVVFQNVNTNFLKNVRSMPNTQFNEIGWLYPSQASLSGENDSYVKFNITEPGMPWDYGSLNRSSWIDINVLGNPLASNSAGVIYQHETTNDADGASITASFTTGYFVIAEGEDFAFVDMIIPDMVYGLFDGSPGATVQFTFNVTNFPGDTPIAYGPYMFNSTTEYIPVRFRGRQMSITVQSSDMGSFWRLGRVRYRWAPCGRR